MSTAPAKPSDMGPDALADLALRRLGGRNLTQTEVCRILREEFPGHALSDASQAQVFDIALAIQRRREQAAQQHRRVEAALTEVATALRTAGKDRDFADASLRETTHLDHHGLLTDVLDKVYPDPAIYDLCLRDSIDRLDVIAAVKLVAANWRAGAQKVRPVCEDEDCYGHGPEAEVDEAVADTYDEAATTLLAAFGLPTGEEA